MGMGMAVVVVGMVVGMGMRHGRTLYYNITGVHVLAPGRSIPVLTDNANPVSRVAE